jgi:hypothetical protein
LLTHRNLQGRGAGININGQTMSQPPNPDDQIPYAEPIQPGYPPTQPQSPYGQTSPYAPVKTGAAHPQQNTMGLTGFIISLISLIVCGFTSIIGLIVSAIGLRREPRGFAVAGAIISLLGIAECAVAIVLMMSMFNAFGEMGEAIQEVAIQMELQESANDVGDQWRESGSIPTQEEGDKIVAGKTDIFQNPIIYETDGSSFSLRSSGADQIEQTEDDVVIGPYSELEDLEKIEFEGLEAFEGIPGFKEGFEEAMQEEAARRQAEGSTEDTETSEPDESENDF